MSTEHIPYGPVYITEGPHAGRIGNYDDNDIEFPEGIDWEAVDDPEHVQGQRMAIIYFGGFLLTDQVYAIPDQFVREVTTADLLERQEELNRRIHRFSVAQRTAVCDVDLRKNRFADRASFCRWGSCRPHDSFALWQQGARCEDIHIALVKR
jgi:hypothetical protein